MGSLVWVPEHKRCFVVENNEGNSDNQASSQVHERYLAGVYLLSLSMCCTVTHACRTGCMNLAFWQLNFRSNLPGVSEVGEIAHVVVADLSVRLCPVGQLVLFLVVFPEQHVQVVRVRPVHPRLPTQEAVPV